MGFGPLFPTYSSFCHRLHSFHLLSAFSFLGPQNFKNVLFAFCLKSTPTIISPISGCVHVLHKDTLIRFLESEAKGYWLNLNLIKQAMSFACRCIELQSILRREIETSRRSARNRESADGEREEDRCREQRTEKPTLCTYAHARAHTHTLAHASKLARPGPKEKESEREVTKAKKYRIYYKRGKESKPLQSSMNTFSRLTKMVAYACLHAKIIFCQRHGKQLKANPRARPHFHELQGFAMSFCSGAWSCNRSIDPGVFLIEKNAMDLSVRKNLIKALHYILTCHHLKT